MMFMCSSIYVLPLIVLCVFKDFFYLFVLSNVCVLFLFLFEMDQI